MDFFDPSNNPTIEMFFINKFFFFGLRVWSWYCGITAIWQCNSFQYYSQCLKFKFFFGCRARNQKKVGLSILVA